MNRRAPLLVLGDRAGPRLAGAIVVAAIVWVAFLARIGWLFGSAPEPVRPQPETIDMRLVEIAPPSAAAPSMSNAAPPAQPRVVERTVVAPPIHPPLRPERRMQATSPTAAPAQAAPPPVAAAPRDAAPHETALPRQPEHATDTGTASVGASSPSQADSPATHASASGGTPARLVSQPLPVLPDDLRDQGYQAVAVARFQVHPDGSFDVELVKPTQNPRLNQILLETLRKWRFFPAMESGHPVESSKEVRVHFNVS